MSEPWLLKELSWTYLSPGQQAREERRGGRRRGEEGGVGLQKLTLDLAESLVGESARGEKRQHVRLSVQRLRRDQQRQLM